MAAIEMATGLDDLEEPVADEQEDRDGRRPGVPFEVLLERFQRKMEGIPPEYHAAMGWLYVYRQLQRERKALANRANQFSEGKRVFWRTVLPGPTATPMADLLASSIEPIMKAEEMAGRQVAKQMLPSSWHQQVAMQAAGGVGISREGGAITSAKLMWAYGSASRFRTFGCMVRYSRLAPENGMAPKPERGKVLRYNPSAWQALYDLSESWLRMPDCQWRQMWDNWKAVYGQEHPDYPKGRIHNMARRRVLREFLRDLYDLWLLWEAAQGAARVA